MVQQLDYSLYDDRSTFKLGSARGDIYKTTCGTLVLFYESPVKQAYVLPNLTMVIKNEQQASNVVCTLKDTSNIRLVAATFRPFLFHADDSLDSGVVSVYVLAWRFSHVEDVESMQARQKDSLSTCVFRGGCSAFEMALNMVHAVEVQTLERRVVHAAVTLASEEADADDSVELDACEPEGFTSFTCLPRAELDDGGVEETKHGHT